MLSYIRSALRSNSAHESSNPVTVATEAVEKLSLSIDPETDLVEWKETVFDIIKDIKDPEKDETLEELEVVRENLVFVSRDSADAPFYSVRVEFVPTVPHCSLATLIGLCLITKLNRELPSGRFKIDLAIAEGTHTSGGEITKQINDKERVAAALENPNLRKTVEECIREKEA